mgnify:CR=1 FL=1
MVQTSKGNFAYVDLFSGIGGFAAAFNSFGGTFIAGAEIDKDAAAAYLATFGHDPFGSVQDLAKRAHQLEDFEVLAGGFPCQPFSKSGWQRGTSEERGVLFDFIEKIIEVKKPLVVLLENVRNLAGPKHLHEWNRIINTLREHGYRVSRTPAEFSPHLLPLELGGAPQHRVRLFITATLNPDADGRNSEEPPPAVTLKDFDDISWDIFRDLQIDEAAGPEYSISASEEACLLAWDEWLTYWRKAKLGKFPSFPLWTEYWMDALPRDFATMPEWKKKIVMKNIAFFKDHRKFAHKWLRDNRIRENFTRSKGKFEWQAGEANSIWDCLIQFRPSGVRVKSPSYVPTLVALNQTPIVGKLKRRITVREAAQLQGFPEVWVASLHQSHSATYKQLGNAVNTGVIAYVLRKHCERDADLLQTSVQGRRLLSATKKAQGRPLIVFENLGVSTKHPA